jgi:hypothetical protein
MNLRKGKPNTSAIDKGGAIVTKHDMTAATRAARYRMMARLRRSQAEAARERGNRWAAEEHRADAVRYEALAEHVEGGK